MGEMHRPKINNCETGKPRVLCELCKDARNNMEREIFGEKGLWKERNILSPQSVHFKFYDPGDSFLI